MPVREMSAKDRDALFGAGLVLFGYGKPERKQEQSPKESAVDVKSQKVMNETQAALPSKEFYSVRAIASN